MVIDHDNDIDWNQCEVRITDRSSRELGYVYGIYYSNQLVLASPFRSVCETIVSHRRDEWIGAKDGNSV